MYIRISLTVICVSSVFVSQSKQNWTLSEYFGTKSTTDLTKLCSHFRMRSLVIFSLLVLVIIGTAIADDPLGYHRFCGDHGECDLHDKDHPDMCCIRGKLNNYHECLDNPNPGQKCKESDLNWSVTGGEQLNSCSI